VPTDRAGNALCGKCGATLDKNAQVPESSPAPVRRTRRAPRLVGLDWWVGAAVLLFAVVAIWSYKPTTEGGTTASIAAPPPSVPLCARRPVNGEILKSVGLVSYQGHTLEIRNGSGGDAIVKVKDAATGRSVVSFFVANAATASVDHIPDGNYRIQFAFGKYVDQACKNFVGTQAASQFPSVESLVTRVTETETLTGHLIYTLYTVASGNVSAQSLDPAVFDTD
jgi:hypothetical protein